MGVGGCACAQPLQVSAGISAKEKRKEAALVGVNTVMPKADLDRLHCYYFLPTSYKGSRGLFKIL